MINWIKELWNRHKYDQDWKFLVLRIAKPINTYGLELDSEDILSLDEPAAFITLLITHKYYDDLIEQFGMSNYRVACITADLETKNVDSEGIVIGHYSQVKDLLKEIEEYDS